MIELINAVLDPDNQFLRIALCAGVLAGISFGITGTYITARRITYLAGAIAHCAFGGIGAGLFLRHKLGIIWFDPIYGAVIFALIGSLITGFVSLKAEQNKDAVIGAVWTLGMALGIIFLDFTSGYFDITSYLFGDILLISGTDLVIISFLDFTVILFSVFFYHKLAAVCFDQEFAGLRGINAKTYYILLLCFTGISIVLLVRVVGIIMVIAMLTLPSAISAMFAKRLWEMMLFSTIFCIIFICAGIEISYLYGLSTGATIIIISGTVYLGTLFLKKHTY